MTTLKASPPITEVTQTLRGGPGSHCRARGWAVGGRAEEKEILVEPGPLGVMEKWGATQEKALVLSIKKPGF